MKTLSSILQKNYANFMDEKQLPSFTEGTIIIAIMDRGSAVRCEPQSHHGIRCPMCGGDQGYRVTDTSGYWWACRRSKCIQKNAGRQEIKQKKEDSVDVLAMMGVSPRLLEASFDQWKHSSKLKEELKNFAARPQEAYTFTGTNGVGKSYAAVAIMREYRNKTRETALFYNVSTLYQEWLSQRESPNALMYKLINIPLLVLDDLGTRTPSDAFGDFLYLIINSRYADVKGTVITTNLSVAQLTEKFGNAIVSRLAGGEIIEMEGENLRNIRS